MTKIFRVIILFTMLLMLNILNVDAKEISDIDELKECISNKNTCTLINNIENNSDSVEIISSTDVTLDLNGYSITNYNFVIDDGEFTLNDSKENGYITTTANYGISVTEASIIINGGKIESNLSAINFDKSTAIINDGEFIGLQYGCRIDRDSNVEINKGSFKGLSKGNYDGGYGVSSNRSTIVINSGNFIGKVYGFHSSGCGRLEIKDGNFEGEDGGIWLSNSYTCSNSENQSLINGGIFKGKVAARIQGNNTNIITGGTYDGTQIGLEIQCANPIYETCKDAIILKGGYYKSLGNNLGWPFFTTAIFMNSDPDSPVKISDLLDNGYELSDNNLLEKDGGAYGYYSYTESLNVSISNPNLNDFDKESTSNSDEPKDDEETTNDEIIENPKTGCNIGYISIFTIILAVVSIITYIKIKKASKFPKSL